MAVTRRVHVFDDRSVDQYPEDADSKRIRGRIHWGPDCLEKDMNACITNGERIVQVLHERGKFIVFTEDYGLGPPTS